MGDMVGFSICQLSQDLVGMHTVVVCFSLLFPLAIHSSCNHSYMVAFRVFLLLTLVGRLTIMVTILLAQLFRSSGILTDMVTIPIGPFGISTDMVTFRYELFGSFIPTISESGGYCWQGQNQHVVSNYPGLLQSNPSHNNQAETQDSPYCWAI